jgi:hypothetical protein
MHSTFKVEELEQDIKVYLSDIWNQFFEGKVLRNNHPGWQNGKITLKFSVEIQFQPDNVEVQDSLDELRNMDA